MRYSFPMRSAAVRRIPGGGTAALLSALFACGPTVSVNRLVPAPYNLGPARKLVLVETTGNREPRLRATSRFLEDVRADGVFAIADASHAGVPLSELGEGDAARMARRFRDEWPADVYVRIEVADVSSRKKSETRKEKTKSGEEVERTRYFAEASCTVGVRLVDARTGRLLASFQADEFRTTRRHDAWDDGLRREAEEDAVDAAVREAVKEFTPRRVSEALPLEKDAPGATVGIARVEAEDLRGARRLWEETLKTSPDDARLRYNLGAVSEALGDFKAAAAYYEDAIRLAPGESKYRSALADLEERRRDADALRTRG